MSCPSCGTDNPEGAKFCNGCGAQLVRTCPSCGTSNAPGAKFCSECGATLQVTSVPAPPPAVPAAERRLVTVLFADLVGFTTLSESRDAEETRELLSRYFELSSDADRPLRRHGREVHRGRGDGRLGHADRDRGRRRAGRPRRARPRRSRSRSSTPALQARAGVLTGEAAVTIGAEGQGMVAGDLVNTASRIQSAAEPGHGARRRGRRARRRSRRSSTQDAGAHELKGKSEPVPLFRALRVVSGVGGDAQVGRARGAVRRSRPRAASWSRISSTRAAEDGRRTSSRSPASPASASRVSRGSSTSTSTGSSSTSTGTAAAACRTARASRTGRSPTWCGCAAGSARTSRPTRRGAKLAATLDEHIARRGRAGVRRAAARAPARPRRGGRRRPPGPLRRVAALLRAARRRQSRPCSSSRTCSGPTRACSTSSSTCSSGRATTRCS